MKKYMSREAREELEPTNEVLTQSYKVTSSSLLDKGLYNQTVKLAYKINNSPLRV